MTTALEIIKAAYPSQYGGIINNGRIASFIDVWKGRTYDGGYFNVLGLPSADSMAILTPEQWALLAASSVSGMLNVFVDGATVKYPHRFYCDKSSPCAVYDMWGYSSVEGMPAVTDLYPIAISEFTDRQQNYRPQYFDTSTGKLEDYIAPIVPVLLKDQAATENSGWVQAQISEAVAMGETFSDEMKTYVKAIRAIASGSDTTSTALPARPETVFS